jgi:hypothetical protein
MDIDVAVALAVVSVDVLFEGDAEPSEVVLLFCAYDALLIACGAETTIEMPRTNAINNLFVIEIFLIPFIIF